jgi:Uma2 family endonuclease
MIDAGILTDDDPVELMDGMLVAKLPKSPSHRLTTQLAREAMARILPDGWFVDAQEPVTLADSEPEPDGLVVRGDRRAYVERHPGAEDLALVIEVADATLHRDRTLKQRLYAAAATAIYWIINLPDAQIEVYSDPSGPAAMPRYRQRQDYRDADKIPLVIDGQPAGRITVRELLP